MDRKLVLTAAKQIKQVIATPLYDIYSTEWGSGYFVHEGVLMQYIAIRGSNDVVDWLWNVCMLSWDGIKLGSYIAARRVKRNFVRDPEVPLLVCGHSKAGPTALYLGKLLKADHCIAFNPPPGFRKAEKLKNSLVIVDPDDIVHKLGVISFKHPICEYYFLPNDPGWINLKDHNIDNSIEHFSN